ncbi:hypothetical protein KPJ26_19610, partial [Escherichia coli]|nr:hypothetical protein [Escherichia coli]
SFAAFWLHNNKGRLTRGCNPAYSKSIHTWLRFGEIMRGSLSTLRLNLIHIKNNVSSNLAEILFILCTILAYIVQSIIGSCTGDGDL